MSRGWTFVSGDWNCICDRCGQKLKASELKQEWTGLIVCTPCWEPRHPQDFIRTRTDKISVPFSRHPTDKFIDDPIPVVLEDGSFWVTHLGEFVIANNTRVEV